MVSVPDGAPGKVKEGDLPKPEADRKFEYLWNCRAALDPVSRIVIATDGDAPGRGGSDDRHWTLNLLLLLRVSV